jgi:hypothetical protein
VGALRVLRSRATLLLTGERGLGVLMERFEMLMEVTPVFLAFKHVERKARASRP